MSVNDIKNENLNEKEEVVMEDYETIIDVDKAAKKAKLKTIGKKALKIAGGVALVVGGYIVGYNVGKNSGCNVSEQVVDVIDTIKDIDIAQV